MKFSLLRRIVILFSISFFLYMSFLNLRYIGLNDDEIAPAILGLNLSEGLNLHMSSDFTLGLFGTRFPTNMFQEYTFQLPSYLLIIPFAVFGPVYSTFKSVFIFAGLLLLLVNYFLIKRIYSASTAALTMLLLSSSMYFIHYNRVSMHATEPLMSLFFYSTVLMCILFLDKGKKYYLYVAAFLLGCCFSIKLSIAVRLAAFAAASVIVYPGIIRKEIHKAAVMIKPMMLIFFILGAGCFVIYNLGTGGRSFRLFKYIFVKEPTQYGKLDNWDLRSNMAMRSDQLDFFLNEKMSWGDGVYPSLVNSGIRFFPREKFGKIYILLFFLNLPMVMLFWREKFRLTLFIDLYALFMYLLSIFSPGSLSPFHLFILSPVPQLLTAVFAVALVRAFVFLKLTRKAGLVFTSLFIIAPFLAMNLQILDKYQKSYSATGGFRYWSDSIFELSDKLKGIDGDNIFTLNWGVIKVITFLSRGTVNIPIENSLANYNSKNPESELEQFILKHEKSYFILVADITGPPESSNERNDLYRAADSLGADIDVFEIIRNKTGDISFIIYEVLNKK